MKFTQLSAVRSYDLLLFFIFGSVTFFLLFAAYLLNSHYDSKYYTAQRDSFFTTISQNYKEAFKQIIPMGKYQLRDYLRKNVNDNRIIKEMVLLTTDGTIMAHSDSALNGKKADAALLSIIHDTLLFDSISKEYILYKTPSSSLVKIATEVVSGREQQLRYILYFTIEDETYNQIYRKSRITIGVMIFLLVFFSLGIIWSISHRFSPLSKSLAKKYESFLQYAPIMLFLQDKEGKILEASKSFYKEFDSCSVCSFYSLMTSKNDEIKMRALDKQILLNKEGRESYVAISTKKGKKNLRLYKFPMFDEKKEVMLCGMLLDISELESLENALRQKSSELEIINKKLQEEITYEIELNKKKALILLETTKKNKLALHVKKFTQSWRQPLNNIYLLISSILDTKEFSKKYLGSTLKKCELELERLSRSVLGFDSIFGKASQPEKFIVQEVLDLAHNFVKYDLRTKNISIRIQSGGRISLLLDKNYLTELFILIIALIIDLKHKDLKEQTEVKIRVKKVLKSKLVIQFIFRLLDIDYFDLLRYHSGELDVVSPGANQYIYLIQKTLSGRYGGEFFASTENENMVLSLEVALEQ